MYLTSLTYYRCDPEVKAG